MNNCKSIKITTPKEFLLNGLWFGPDKAETVFVYVHGLGGSVFAQTDLIEALVAKKNTAVLTFNNRGSGIVTRIKRLNPKKAKGYDSHIIGMAHELFTDCADDIEGAIRLAKQSGAKKIYLVGHSTGCQKSIYYLSLKTKSVVDGVILLAPLSDYAAAVATTDAKDLKFAVKVAQKMVSQGKAHEMMPLAICPYPFDAQRFLSLNTPDSIEEIFSYASPKQKPQLLNKVRIPILIVLAAEDEHLDRPAAEIAAWFETVLVKQSSACRIIDGSMHNFKGHASEVAKEIRDWLAK